MDNDTDNIPDTPDHTSTELAEQELEKQVARLKQSLANDLRMVDLAQETLDKRLAEARATTQRLESMRAALARVQNPMAGVDPETLLRSMSRAELGFFISRAVRMLGEER